jgi:hypothetical protein
MCSIQTRVFICHQKNMENPMPDEGKVPDKAQAAWGAWMPLYAGLFDGNQRAFARWLEDASSLSQEITHFVQARLQEDITASFELVTCRSPHDALECQRQFVEKAADQYSDEIGKLFKIITRMVSIGSLKQERAAAGH